MSSIIELYQKRAQELYKRCYQLRLSRDRWRERALAYQKQIKREKTRTYHARASRDMWKHRALNKRV